MESQVHHGGGYHVNVTSLLLISVCDLHAAYHLIRYGDALWMTDHDSTGYMQSRFMQAGCSLAD